jgi:hypothetical protein
VSQNDEPNKNFYKIRAEVMGTTENQWQDGLRFVWYNSSYYLCKKSELIMDGNQIELLLDNSNDIQDAIDALSNSISKADKIPKSS